MALVGAAAAILLVLGGYVVVRATHSSPPSSQKMQLVAPTDAPSAWAKVSLHARSDGTIVDLEAGDLPHSGASFSVKVSGAGQVIGTQDFTVNNDGWAQVLLATSRPLHKGDTIEVTQRTTGAPVTVLRCSCGL
jgi:type II secretory pathway component GspD/PulD (secretin)